ncbi:MAG: hypothetical protein IKG47_06985 [Oscillospiraceae bacterium]|nr:hypothetical protein [Oscillospiraceae bacterium]
MTHFTEEEKLIISMFRSNGRLITVSKIRAAMADVDNDEMMKLMQSTADKLIDITEKEYRQLSESFIT